MADERDRATKELEALISSKKCAPILLRLAFHDAGTYDALSKTGGPNGSIRIAEEYNRDDNKGIKIAVDLCEEVKKKCPSISYADIYQLAGIVAVKQTGGPHIDFEIGRKDSTEPSPPNRLPVVQGQNVNHAKHLREVFYRMGFSDQDIVALSGAHTLGKAHIERSGYDGAWTPEQHVFDNSYFIELLTYDQNGRKPVNGRVMLPTDVCLLDDKCFKKYVLLYSKDKQAFFEDYKRAHKKMSELGFKQFPNPYTKNLNKPILFALTIVLISVLAAYNQEMILKLLKKAY